MKPDEPAPESADSTDAIIRAAIREVREYEAAAARGGPGDSRAKLSDGRDPLAAPPADSFAGYQIVREVQRGGQGVVYQAIQRSTEREVAIKVMKEGPFVDPHDLVRFKREVQILGQLHHPNIVVIHDSGQTDGRFYYVMDYIGGDSLDNWAARPSRTAIDSSSSNHRSSAAATGPGRPVAQVLRVFAKVCDAVNAAHLQGIIHRDLKPGNIRVDSADEPHVLDFGMAKLSESAVLTRTAGPHEMMSQSGEFLGTPAWASPEQAARHPDQLDLRTDVYSLGVILYQLITGRFPYDVSGSLPDVLTRIQRSEPVRPRSISRRIDDDLETIVLRCLAKDRERRYQSAGELSRDIQHYLADDPIEAKRDSVFYVLRKRLLHRRKEAIAVAAALVGAIVFGGTAVRSAHDAAAARALAQAEGLIKESIDRLMSGRSEAALALERATQATEAAPEFDQAWSNRGRVRAIAGLQARLDRKAEYARMSLDDLAHAHTLAGGAPFLSDGTGSATQAADGRTLATLTTAYDIAALTRNEELSNWLMKQLRALPPAPGGFPRWPPIYDRQADSLLHLPPHESPAVAGLRPLENAELTRVIQSEIRSLDPLSFPTEAAWVIELLHDPLFVYNEDLECIPNPNVVEGQPSSDDGLTWEVRLKPDLRWHDDHPFTADDVQFTYEYLLSGDSPLKQLLTEVKAVTPDRLRFTLRQKLADPFLPMRFVVFPQHIGNTKGWAALRQELGQAPVGNGPYVFDGWLDDRAGVALRRWDSYRGTRPYLARVVFKFLPPERLAERVNGLAEGHFDEIELRSNEFRWDVNGDESFKQVNKVCHDRITYDRICWNLTGRCAGLTERRVRRALAHAVDLEIIRNQDFGGLFPPFRGIWGARTWAVATESGIEVFGHDPQKAAALLDEAGWRLDGSRSVRRKDGQDLRLTVLVMKEATSLHVALIRIRRQLEDVGAVIDFELAPPDECRNRLRGGDFDAYLGSVIPEAVPVEDWRYLTTGAESNYGGYSSEVVDTLFDDALRAADSAEQIAILREIQKRVYDDQPYLFLWQKPALWAFNQRVRGVRFSSLGPAGFYPGPRAWWVAAESRR